MRPYFLFAILISLALPAYSNPTKTTAYESPNYSQLKRLSGWEVDRELKAFIGERDNWKNTTTLIHRFRSFLPFKKKLTPENEARELSYIYAQKSPRALQEYTIRALQSSNKEIKQTIANVRGDKRLAYESYSINPRSNKLGMLFFFKGIQYGDTGLERRKFQHFSLAFQGLAHQIEQAYRSAANMNMPLIIEFESSAFLKESPLTRTFYNLLINDSSGLTRVQSTPNGGKLVALYPARAQNVVENLNLFSEQLKKSIRLLQQRYFESPEIQARLVDLIRNAEGVSGLFYIDEKIVEMALAERPHRSSAKSCAALFNN